LYRKFDKELEKLLHSFRVGSTLGNRRNSCDYKKEPSLIFQTTPKHMCLRLELNKNEKYFEKLAQNFGLIGLHTCGNLAPVVLHNFVNSPAKFVVSVGCCYMKLNNDG